MSKGLFDIIGPIMHGPSSNHTAGANRIGYFALEIMGGMPEKINLGFHPAYMDSYVGQRTHSAMIAGLLGYREYEDDSINAMDELFCRGITWRAYPIAEDYMSRNTFRANCETDGESWEINSDSIGGGNIVINRINGMPAYLDGNQWELVMTSEEEDLLLKTKVFVEEHCKDNLRSSDLGQNLGSKWLYIGEYARRPCLTIELPDNLKNAIDEGRLKYRLVKPLFKFPSLSDDPPLFSRYDQLLSLCKDRPILDIIISYEAQRSHSTAEDILKEARLMVDVIETALIKGENETIHLIGGLTDPGDGKKIMAWARSGKTVVNEMFSLAIGRSIVLAQMNASGNKIVAAPTGGAAGTVPGTLFSAAERYGKGNKELAEAFLIAAAIGLIIGNKASFSGTCGGCQSEVGIGAAMAAGAVTWLAGGEPEKIVQAATIALKNVLGLTCDPPASPPEVPCIKRNGMGAAIALMGAEMALAGIRSAIDPDDVVDALADTQRLLPTELKFSHCAGLAATKSGVALNTKWKSKLKDLI
jgi:L-serine dehydratase